jgi:hypothetical protein
MGERESSMERRTHRDPHHKAAHINIITCIQNRPQAKKVKHPMWASNKRSTAAKFRGFREFEK